MTSQLRWGVFLGLLAFCQAFVPNPLMTKVGHGAFCTPCKDLVKGGEELGEGDLDHWLDINIGLVCDTVLLVIHHDCEKELKKVKAELKKAIEDGVPPEKACKDVDFC